MKKLIENYGGMETFVELRPFEDAQHPGWYHLKFSTIWDHAKFPGERTNYEMCLSPEAFSALKEVIDAM